MRFEKELIERVREKCQGSPMGSDEPRARRHAPQDLDERRGYVREARDMSMVHPGMLTARSGANDGPRADDDLRQYVHSEYREKETHWLASSGIRGDGLKVPRARDTSTMPDIVDLDNTVPARVRETHLIMSAFSENRLIKWLVPRGETAGER